MKRSLLLSVLAVALVASAGKTAVAQDVTLSLDLFYLFNDSGNRGSWQLYALAEGSEGLAGVDTQISGLEGATNETFLAPDGDDGFKSSIESVAFNADQDSDATTLDMVFGQVPLESGMTQDLIYNAVNTGAGSQVNNRLLNTVDPSGTSMTGSVLLAYGTFGPGSSPAFTSGGTTGGSEANVFTTVGTSTAPGTVVGADLTTQIRNNTGSLGKAGDANLDGDVDVFQLNGGGDAQILGANLGCNAANGDVCLWQNADFNGDRDVDVFQLNGQGDAQILGGSLGTDAPAGTAIAIYNAITGELIFDIGADVSLVGIETVGLVNASVDEPSLGGKGADQFDANVIAYFDFSSPLPVGEWSQGLVMETGLDASQIGFGYQSGGENFQGEVQVIIPEPTSMVLVGMSLVGLGLCRRRIA